MLHPLISRTQIDAVSSLVGKSHRISVICHMTPDGDAMGSSLCLASVLSAMGKSVCVITPDCPPESLMFLPGADRIMIASYHPERARNMLAGAQLIFCLDFNDFRRIDRVAPMVEASSAKRILIDHHLNPNIDVDVMISHPEKSSTCALLYTLLEQAQWTGYVDADAATCCCAGMMTDTGNFTYNSNDSELYVILSELLRKGVDKDAIYTRLFNTNSLRRIRIMGYGQYAKMQVMPEHQAALITLSRDELDEFGYEKGDTESLVNVPLSIPGITYSIFLREDERDYVKVSMRSKGDFSVKELCETYFGGGGHKNAAGGEVRGSLADAVDCILRLLPLCDAELPAPNIEN